MQQLHDIPPVEEEARDIQVFVENLIKGVWEVAHVEDGSGVQEDAPR